MKAYGPRIPRTPGETGIAFTTEAGGTVATCRVCGWLVWNELRTTTERDARGHQCRIGDRCLICGRPYEIGDDGCPHRTTKSTGAPQ